MMLATPTAARFSRRKLGSDATYRAFTLVEVAVALFVIVVGVLPMIALFLTSRALNEQAQYQAIGYNAARQEMENLREQRYTDRHPATRVSFPLPANVVAQFGGQVASGDYDIADVTSTAAPGAARPAGTYGDATHPVQQIVVRVHWHNAASPTSGSSVTLDSLIAEGAEGVGK